MRKSALAIIVFLIVTAARADNGEYAVSKIPAALLKNADAVLRVEELRFEIISTKEAVQNYHYAITILNENGEKWAEFIEYYDKLREVSSVQGFLYDASGNPLKKIKTKDLQDMSGMDNNSLMDDNRIKRHNFYYKVYPYTIEYDVEIRYRYTLFFPKWIPQGGERLSVEKSQVSIVCPEDYKFRYKAFQYQGDPVISTEKGKRSSTWAVNNMPGIVREPYQPPLHELTTVVIFGPTEFQVGDYKGNMQSWQDFGKFIFTLKQGRDDLPDNVKLKIHQLVEGISDEKKKIRVLYDYLQKNTRYISIQLGIGGWQPFDAKFVAAKSYGDCKALTNYMSGILKEAGIKSHYTLVRAGEYANYITEDFPSQQFNHVILCVPLKSDTVWLECTSQTTPAGYMGGFTGNRYALLVNENGGNLVRTPRYGLKENIQSRKISAELNEDGALNVKAATLYSGMQQDDIQGLINGLSRDKVKEYLHEQLDFPTYDINKFEYKENKTSLPTIDESLDIVVSNYATITGKRLFIIPNVMTRTHRKLSADTARKYGVVLSYEYKDIDTTEMTIPAGYTIESVPTDTRIETKFGKFTASVKVSGNRIDYCRSFEQYSGRFPPRDYMELVKFYDAVYKADRNRLVLVKNPSQ